MRNLLCDSKALSDTTVRGLQSEHANPGSSESDLVSGKMKEEVIFYNNTSMIRIYNT